MPGPSTNLSGSNHSHIPSDACTSDYIDMLRSFKDGNCMVATVGEGKTSVFTALNLGSSVVTFERIIEDKCDVELYLPYKPDDCVVQLTAATPVQPIKMPGRYRMCISPANPDALIQQKDFDFGSSACCVIDTKCQPVVVAPPPPPVTCAVTGLPAPLVAPFIWLGQKFESTSAFVAAVLQSTGGGTFNFATATFTLPPNSTCPALVVSAVPVEPPAPPVPCPSIALPGGGFMYHPADILDPAATTVVGDCVTAGSVLGYIYPTAGVGHTVAVEDCVGGILGYAQNCSECACSSLEKADDGQNVVITGSGMATVTSTVSGFNVHVPPVSLCTELTNFIASATAVALQPTDEFMVVRNGLCAKGTLAKLLADKWFANTSMTYNPANGEITLVQLDETGAVANTFTIDIGPFVETPWSSVSTNSILVTNGGTNGHTPELNVNVSGAAGNSLSVTSQGLYVPTPVVPDSPALVVTKNGSTDGVAQSGTLGHTVDVLVETTEVYVNGVAVPDSDLSATNRRYDITLPAPLVCPDAAAVAVELCPTDEIIDLGGVGCTPRKVKLPKAQAAKFNQVPQTSIDLATACATVTPQIIERFHETIGDHAKPNWFGSFQTTSPGAGQTFGPFPHGADGYLLIHAAWGMSRYAGFLPNYQPGGLGDVLNLNYTGNGAASPAVLIDSQEFVQDEYSYGDPANNIGAMRHAIYFMPITAAASAGQISAAFPNLVNGDGNQRLTIKVFEVVGHAQPVLITQEEFGDTNPTWFTNGTQNQQLQPVVFETPAVPAADTVYMNLLAGTRIKADNFFYPPIAGYPSTFFTTEGTPTGPVPWTGTVSTLRTIPDPAEGNDNYIGVLEVYGSSFSNSVANRHRVGSSGQPKNAGHGYMISMAEATSGGGAGNVLHSSTIEVCEGCPTANGSFVEWSYSGGSIEFDDTTAGYTGKLYLVVDGLDYLVAEIDTTASTANQAFAIQPSGIVSAPVMGATCANITYQLKLVCGTAGAGPMNITINGGYFKAEATAQL